MPKVVADPQRMRQFGSNLASYASDLKENISHLRSLFQTLSEFWRDQKQQRFEQEFTRAMAELERFVRSSEETVCYLGRKAEALERYLST